MTISLANEMLLASETERLVEPPAASFWLGSSKLRVVAADTLDPEMINAAVGEIRLTGLRFVIMLQDRSTTGARNAVDLLTKRELQIALLVAAGKVNKQITHRLGISAYTVSSYLKRIFCKLNCRTRAEMAAQVIETMGQNRGDDAAGDP